MARKKNDENPQTTEEALAFVRDLQNKILYLNSTGESYRKIIADYERAWHVATLERGNR